MNITVFLVLYFLFGGYRHAAHATAKQSAQYLRVNTAFGFVSTPYNHGLHSVKQCLFYDCLVPALVYLASVAKMSLIKRVHQHCFDLVDMQRLATFGSNAVTFQIVSNIL